MLSLFTLCVIILLFLGTAFILEVCLRTVLEGEFTSEHKICFIEGLFLIALGIFLIFLTDGILL